MVLQSVSYIDYYSDDSVYTFNLHVPYLIVLTNQNQALVTSILILLIVIYKLPIGGPCKLILFYMYSITCQFCFAHPV